MTMIRRLILIGLGGFLFLGAVYLTAVAALAPLRQESLAQLRIFAYRDWQSTGVRLENGEFVTIRARGEWLYTPGEYHGPEGHARYPAPSFYPLPHREGPYQMGPGVPGGVLIGRIGESGAPFLVGKYNRIPVSETGTLYLRINDDILSDNEGWVEVQIDVQPAEEETR
ncbi:MAG: hypothetical protein DCC57_21865 [Chloroflexi bacterium]|nr:MAG: hypothetical protein DCC57_21865 [Chloroflexota bacterium]